MRVFSRPLLALAAGLIAGCSDSPTSPTAKEIDELPRALTGAEQQISSAGNGFSFSLFRQINEAQPDSNVFISPLSASMALGMTMNGAAGTTYDAMRGTLGFAGATQSDINNGYKGLIALLRGLDSATDFRIANSIWYRNGFPFEPLFLSESRDYFDAEVTGLDFGDPASPTTINSWVDRSTNGKIDKILDEIDPDHVMFLINAIYFKGSWQQRFNKSETHNAPFHSIDGTVSQVPLMHKKDVLRYLETSEFQSVDLLYGNSAFAMTVLLPKAHMDVNALVASMSEAEWKEWTEQFRETEAELFLPKFKLEYERKMNDDLTALGMGIAFTTSADFTRMSPRGRELSISYVKQKTYVDVYEEGTEAAAVTVVGIEVTSLPSIPVMNVNRPFVFAIRERFSGTILFIGKIVELPAS